ncbi:MAG: hypothetical protein EXS41_06660 [Opitutaceae bacterium]|nr:hypothetical protein [Opitutaceae bacterium]
MFRSRKIHLIGESNERRSRVFSAFRCRLCGAGNSLYDPVIGSIEYAVEHLHASVLVVVGHGGSAPHAPEEVQGQLAPRTRRHRSSGIFHAESA